MKAAEGRGGRPRGVACWCARGAEPPRTPPPTIPAGGRWPRRSSSALPAPCGGIARRVDRGAAGPPPGDPRDWRGYASLGLAYVTRRA